MNTSSSHISLEDLANLAENRVRSKDRATAMTHISTCSACGSVLNELQHAIAMMRSDSAEDAPRDVLASVINIFPRTTQQSLLRRIVAALTFDSLTSAPAFGTRSAQTASRQLLYSADERDLDLRITLQNEKCIVAGQVIGEGCAGGLVEISGAIASAEASLNELCEFVLPAVSSGNYSLRIKLADVEIDIPDLQLKV